MHLACRAQNCRTKYIEWAPEGHLETPYSTHVQPKQAAQVLGQVRFESIFKHADSTYLLDTCSHTVKPYGETSPTVKMVFQESRIFLCSTSSLLATSQSLYTLEKRLGPSRSKHVRDTSQVHPKEELFGCIQILGLKLKL